MDSARDFDLLGESVPQVRVSAHTLSLIELFHTHTHTHTHTLTHTHTHTHTNKEEGSQNK